MDVARWGPILPNSPSRPLSQDRSAAGLFTGVTPSSNLLRRALFWTRRLAVLPRSFLTLDKTFLGTYVEDNMTGCVTRIIGTEKK